MVLLEDKNQVTPLSAKMRTPSVQEPRIPLDPNHKIRIKVKTHHYQTQHRSTQVTTMMIMKLVLLLLLALSVSQAFVVVPIATPVPALMALSSVDQANLVQKWAALEARAEELKINPSNDLEYNLCKEMLELALEAVEAAETEEFNNAMQAHKKWEKAEETERSLEKAAHESHVEAVDADDILNTYKKEKFMEDREMRREMAVSEIAHRVENYVESRLAEVRVVEELAKKKEDEAETHLAELFINEDEIRATLEELKALQKSKQQTV